MSAFLLLQAMREYLKPRLAQYPMAAYGRDSMGNPKTPEQSQEPMRPCSVHLGSIPPTPAGMASAAPFLVIQALEGEDTPEGMQNIRVALRVCIVADDYEAAENDLLNIVSQIRLWIMETPEGIVGERFRLLPYGDDASGLPWERPDEQVPPFLQAHIFTQWQTAGAVRRPRPDMVDYE